MMMGVDDRQVRFKDLFRFSERQPIFAHGMNAAKGAWGRCFVHAKSAAWELQKPLYLGLFCDCVAVVDI